MVKPVLPGNLMPKIAFPLRVKAVAIDLDGTMLDTVTDLAIAVNMMLERIGRARLDETLVRNFVGKGINNLVERSLVGALDGKPDPALYEKALPIYMACYAEVNGRHTTMYPQVREGLDALKAAGLASSNSEAVRKLAEGAVRVDGEKVADRELKLPIGAEHILQVGPRRFARVKIINPN